MNKFRCNASMGCTYSKSMDQEFPRKCIKCGHPEESVIDHEYYKARDTKEATLEEIGTVLHWLSQRNHYVKMKLPYDTEGLAAGEEFCIGMIQECNKNIVKILNL